MTEILRRAHYRAPYRRTSLCGRVRGGEPVLELEPDVTCTRCRRLLEADADRWLFEDGRR